VGEKHHKNVKKENFGDQKIPSPQNKAVEKANCN